MKYEFNTAHSENVVKYATYACVMWEPETFGGLWLQLNSNENYLHVQTFCIFQ